MKRILTLLLLLYGNSIFSQTSNDTSKVKDASEKEAQEKIEAIRKDIVNGKIDFATAAKEYSQDPGSSSNGGLYEHVKRGQFVPQFETVGFSIKVNTVSEVFKTKYGYEILLVVARKQDEIDVRHIIIIPEAKTK